VSGMRLTIRPEQLASLENKLKGPAVLRCPHPWRIWVRLEIDPADPGAFSEKFVLRSNGYQREISAASANPNDGFIDLHYDDISLTDRYTLEVHPDGARPKYTIFENLTFDEICSLRHRS